MIVRTGHRVSQAESPEIDFERVRTATLKLVTYCETNDWAGYDPYDALNSQVFRSVPLLDSRWPRLLLTQAFKRSPVNIRRWVGVPKTQNPKALALFLASFIKLSRTGIVGGGDVSRRLVGLIVEQRSLDQSYWCWGYSFPWQTRTLIVPRGAPNLVCTTFVANALLDVYEDRDESRCLEMAVSAADYLLRELYWTSGGTVGFSYPLPTARGRCHNANLLGAALLARVHNLTGDRRFLSPAVEVARSAAAAQALDGSWAYGEHETQQWIDNFHTGFNLCALQQMGNALETDEFDSAARRGLKFYRSHFFRHDGAARYFHNRTFPIDAHSVAQSIITLLAFRNTNPQALRWAGVTCEWALDHMWDERGFFYYQVFPGFTIRTSYMRWTQAWMLMALATMLESADVGTRVRRLAKRSPSPAERQP